MIGLSERIKEVSLIVAPNYPFGDDPTNFERLYAIESSYQGTDDALAGAHRVIQNMKFKLGMSDSELTELWELLDKEHEEA